MVVAALVLGAPGVGAFYLVSILLQGVVLKTVVGFAVFRVRGCIPNHEAQIEKEGQLW